MLEKVFHLLSGYAEFQVEGDGPRFFNITAKSRIGLWGYRRREGLPVARIKAREYKKLRGAYRRSWARPRLLKKRGAPFLLHRLEARKGLLLGALCGGALYWFLSGFLWGVSVTGTQLMPPSRVLEAAARQGLYQGCAQREMNPRGAALGILSELPELSWAGISTDGCFAEIAVKEGEPKPQPEEEAGWSNIVASREGKVVEIQAQSGRPEVKLGEAVERGQLLISGLYEEEQDPWAEPNPNPLQVTGPARGSVTAETWRTFTVQVSGMKKEWVETGEKSDQTGKQLFPLPFGPAPTPKPAPGPGRRPGLSGRAPAKGAGHKAARLPPEGSPGCLRPAGAGFNRGGAEGPGPFKAAGNPAGGDCPWGPGAGGRAGIPFHRRHVHFRGQVPLPGRNWGATKSFGGLDGRWG